MESRNVSLLDSTYAFVTFYILIYIQYLSHLLFVPNAERIYFPNPILLILILLFGFFLVSAKQEIDHQDVFQSQAIRWHILALLPTYLLYNILSEFRKSEKSKGNDVTIIWSIRVMQAIIFILTFFFVIVLISILVIEGNIFILLLPVYSSLGLLGWSLGYILSRIRTDPPTWISNVQLFVLRPVIGTQNRRIFFLITCFSLVLLLLVVNIENTFKMLTL